MTAMRRLAPGLLGVILLCLPAAASAQDSLHLDAQDRAVQVTVDGNRLTWPGGSLTLADPKAVGEQLNPRPDSDGDGVPDPLPGDECRDEPGTEPNGCNRPLPPPDSDGDGFPDGSDLCPTEAGVAPDGCPPVLPSEPPVADFSIAPNPAIRNQPATFTSTGTCPETPCTYRWFHWNSTNGAQGEIEAGAVQPNTGAAFTYTGPAGTRGIALRVTDADGQSDEVGKSFQLVDQPPPPPPPPPPPSGDLPNADNTGVPAGTTLTPTGSMTISTAGVVVSGRDFSGQVVVNAPNVTIRNSRIRSNAMWVIDNNSTGLVVEDSEIINRPVAGAPNCHNGIGNSNFTVRRTEITGCENAANIGGDNVTFVDNYVHDLDTEGPSYVWGDSPHTDGLQMSPGADNIVVRHNWIDPSPGGGVTAPIIMGVNGSQSNVWIEDNYLDGRGASYALYANRQPSTNVFINRNRMLKGFGYTACVRLGVTVTQFNDNRDAVTGALLSADNGADGGCSN